MLILIGLLLVLFSGQLFLSLAQTTSNQSAHVVVPPHSESSAKSSEAPAPTVTIRPGLKATTDTDSPSIFVPNQTMRALLQLPGGHYLVYEQKDKLYLVSSTGDYSEVIPTEGFVYSEAVPPILTPSGQLLYSGDGIWITDIFSGTPAQIAMLAPGQVITSMALSDDGKMIAWSTEPEDGRGDINIYAGPLANPSLVYEQSALDCPCFRIFSFMHGLTTRADNTLLLTDDRGSHEAVQYGLWSLDFSVTPANLQLILDENPQQGPLALTPFGNTLLYSTSEGAVPVPTDNSVPPDVAALSYANSLSLASLSGSPPGLGQAQVVLPEQGDLSNSAQYHWVTTPVFSPDGHTLAYVEFSSDAQDPYDRHSALYIVHLSGSGSHLKAGKPQLLATSSSRLVELGAWFNNHILTFYADDMLYAIDTKSGAFTEIAEPSVIAQSSTDTESSNYARIIAVVGSGQT